METAALLVVAVDHPSLDGALADFLGGLRDELESAGHAGSRTPSAELIGRLAASRTMRLGVMAGPRLVAVAAVDNHGAVALAVARTHRRRGIANELMEVVQARAAAIGYPPLHRDAASPARMAG